MPADRRLNGVNPLSYLGVNPPTPPNTVVIKRDPTTKDFQNFSLGDMWINNSITPQRVWILVQLNQHQATWILFAGGAGGDVETLTGDTGGAVPPFLGNINTIGTAGQIHVTGNPATNTLTWSLDGSVANSYPTDFNGPAVPAAGVLNIFGAASIDAEAVALVFRQNIHTNGTGNTVQLKLNDSISLPNTTANGRQGIIYLGGIATGNTFMHNFGTQNTFLGAAAGNLGLTVANAIQNVGIGTSCLFSVTTGAANTALGYSALASLTTGSNNTACGEDAGFALTTGSNNVLLGEAAGFAYTTETGNICIGQNVVGEATEVNTIRISTPAAGFNNIFIGQAAGNNTYTVGTALQNVGIGAQVFTALTTGQHNVALGSGALASVTTGSGNMAVGDSTLAALTTGSNNTGIGFIVLQSLTTASQNTGIGEGALNALLTGGNNTAIGWQAGIQLLGTEANNIFISSVGVTGDNNTTRIGSGTGAGAFQQNLCFISGIRGITTTNNNAIAVLIDSAGQLGTVSSSIRYKENIKDIGSYSNDLMSLRPVIFNFKKHLPSAKSVGLIAEEVDKIFPDLVVYNDNLEAESVKYQDLPVLLLNELQKLYKRVKKLEEKNCKCSK